MTIRPPEFAHARFSTSMWPRAEWRNVYCDLLRRMVTDMDFNVTEEKLSVDATILRLPGVGIADSRTTAFRTIRSRAMAKGTDDYIFFMCLEGAATFSHLGREASIEAGQAILLSSSDPHVIERAMSHHLFITIPKAALGPMAANADAALYAPRGCAPSKPISKAIWLPAMSGRTPWPGATASARAISESCSRVRVPRCRSSCLAGGWRWFAASYPTCAWHTAPSAPSPSTPASAISRPSTTPSAGISA
ncbi:hypothetical protein NKH85_27495 [Mesorhizobium sp. M0924]